MHYVFVGRNETNHIIRGRCEANSKEEVRSLYLKQKIYLTSVKTDIKIFKKRGLSNKEMLKLIEEWKSLEAAKITIQESLSIMHQNASNKRVAQVLQQVILGVGSGLSVVDAFDTCGDAFPSLFLAVLRIGLERGEMGETLETLSEFYHEQNELKGKISSALIYPKILMVIFLVAFIVVCKFIVPSFYSMFQESNVTLNGLTNGVMKGLIYIGEHLLLFGGFFLGLILLFQLLKRSEVVHQKMDFLKLKFFKRYHQIYYAYLFSETLNLLWYCGYAKNESISLCGQVIPNFYIKRELEVVKRQMEQGMYLGAALEEVQIFDPTLCKMLLIGEQGDFLSTNVLNASRYYHLQYKMKLDRLVKMIEPSIILLMAILIGFIILVIFIPMLNAFRLVM